MTVLVAVVGSLPPRLGAWLGRRLGEVGYLVLGRRRRLALANLAAAFPELDPRERRRLSRRAFQHLGLIVVELAGVLRRPLSAWLGRIRLEGLEHLEDVMKRHGRALALSAHLGNWEMLSVAHRLTPYPLAVVVRPLDSPSLQVLAERARLKTGVEIITKRRALGPVLGALSAGKIVGILLDQNASRREGVFVPFFGRPASTSRALAVLALRTGTPIVPIFARRDPDGGHRVVIQAPLAVPRTADRGQAVIELTAACARAIERAVRESPEQWLWMHDRWRTRPAPRA
ncbi:MAG TPA: lysophospholipid acyltransferase family protein [Candidatus Binatia bacterium]|nr:lysophospholipid acyltransferase family protein [Candidatus Binatia bacterium]